MNSRLILFSVITVFSISCVAKRAKMEGMPPANVDVVMAQKQTMPYRYTFVSQTASNLDFTIEPRVNGYLKKKNYRSGQPVKKGDLLFEIEDEPYRIAVAKAEANVASARSTLTNAQANFNRVEPLAKIQALSQSDLDGARSQLLAARAALKVAVQELNVAKLQLSYTRIYAPYQGIGSASNAVVGDYVGAGTNFTVLATVSYLDSVTVNLSLPVAKYIELTKKNNADALSYQNDTLLSDISMQLSDGSIYPYKGIYNYTLTEVDNAADAITFQVLFPNPDYRLKAGQFVRVTATIGGMDDVVTVPQATVTQNQNVYNVWVVKPDSTAEFRTITIGEVQNNDYVVTSGLNPGEMVVKSGFFKMRNGEKVKID